MLNLKVIKNEVVVEWEKSNKKSDMIKNIFCYEVFSSYIKRTGYKIAWGFDLEELGDVVNTLIKVNIPFVLISE